MTVQRRRFEIWSRSAAGTARLHGNASGATFQDACKHLACESIDFWTHFARGAYGDEKLYPSEAEALAGQ